MKVIYKLMSGFLLIAVLAGILGAINVIHNIRILNVAKKDIYKTISDLDDVFNMMEAQEYLEIAANNYLFLSASLSEKKSDFYYEKERLEKLYKKIWNQSCKHIKPQLKKYDKNIKIYISKIEEVFEIHEQGADIETIKGKIREANKYLEIAHDKAIEPIMQRIHKNQIVLIDENMSKGVNKAIIAIVISSVSIVILAIVLGVFFSSSFSKPIIKLKNAVVEISNGNLNAQIDVETKDEVGQLASSFNKMSKNLQETTVSRDYVENIMTSMNDIVVVVTPDEIIEKVNRSTCKLLGYNEEELIGKDISLLFLEEEKVTKFEKLIEEDMLKGYEINFTSKDGRKIPVLLSGAVIKAIDCTHKKPTDDCSAYKEKGIHCEKILSIVYVAKDVTDLKKKEESLQKSEEQFRNFVETINDLVWEVDKNGVYTYVSPKIRDILGYEPEEVVGKTPFDLMPSEEAERVATLFSSIFFSKKPIESLENINFHKDGQQVVLETSGVPFIDKDGNLLGYRGIDRDITERKKAEEKYRVLFESSRDAIMMIAPPTWKFVNGNKATFNMFGINSKQKFISLGPWDVSPQYQPNGRLSGEKAKEMIEKAMKEGSNFFEWMHQTLDGKEFPTTVLLTRMEIEGKQLLQATVRNITEQRKAEETIINLAKFPSEDPSPVLRIRTDGTLLYANESSGFLLDHWNCKVGESVPDSWHIMVTECFTSQQNKVKESEFEEKFYSFILSPVVEEDYVNIYGRDITETKLAEMILAREQKRFQDIFQKAHIGFIVIDGETEEVFLLNKRGMELFRLKKEYEVSYFSESYNNIFEENIVNKISDIVRKIRDEKSVVNFGDFIIDESCVLNFAGYPIMIDDIVSSIVIGVDDVSERKILEKQLLMSSRLAGIGELAAGVAHEINNPVGFITSNTEVMQDYMKKLKRLSKVLTSIRGLCDSKGDIKPEELDIFIKEINDLNLDPVFIDFDDILDENIQGLERVKKIVMNLKKLSYGGEEEKVAADINQLLEDSLNILHNEIKYKAEIIRDFGSLELIQCYPNELLQVFINIINNAGQAIEERGTISLKTFLSDSNVVVKISDTGVGMDEKTKERVFNTFFTTKPVGEGTGLGLSISLRIIEKHNGKVTIESQSGKGTTFTISLPVA
ncbi:MAG: PAS domain S-box protein [Candidatus Aureabacteria bacterium]|nr:PAS domain S-box protein [Candidatus Auribacterota bacterium]